MKNKIQSIMFGIVTITIALVAVEAFNTHQYFNATGCALMAVVLAIATGAVWRRGIRGVLQAFRDGTPPGLR